MPLLVGFDREEDAILLWLENGGSFPTPYLNTNWVRDTNALVGPTRGAEARSLYPPDSYDSLLWSYITMRTDAVRGCPIRRLAKAVAAHAPVWRYLYTHTYENDPFFEQFRASHILEDPLVWHQDLFGYGHVLTPTEEVLSQRMTDYWTNFAKTGNPNGPGLPRWPAYNTVTEPILALDYQVEVIANYHERQCALLDTIPEPFPLPWEGLGKGPMIFPPGFLYGNARAP